MGKRRKYIIFMVIIVVFLFVDLLLLKINKYYYLKYNPIDFIYGIFIGYTIFLLNKCVLKLLTYPQKNIYIEKNHVFSKSPFLILLKLFPTKFGFMMIIIHIVSCVILEELIFRKYLLGFFVYTIKLNAIVALIIVAVLHALFHFDFRKIIPLTILGLVLTGLVVFTNNLFLATIVHFINNIIIIFRYKFKKAVV
jgi:membrane protease YdiL (CAAX protease family)